VVLWPGVWLPSILPLSPSLHTALWNAHFYLALLFFAVVLLHVAAALFHALIRRDGVFDAMGPALRHDEVAPAERVPARP
jgi:cytochrome b561